MQGLLSHRRGLVIWLVPVAVLLCGLAWLGWHQFHQPIHTQTLSAQARLGHHVFHDPSLSASGQQSCASCHLKELGHASARGLEIGGVDGLLGEHGLTWLGPNFDGLNLFGANEAEVRSVALIRMAPQFPGAEASARHAICAFGSPEVDGFTPTMGCELVAFIARVVERTAERWPILT